MGRIEDDARLPRSGGVGAGDQFTLSPIMEEAVVDPLHKEVQLVTKVLHGSKQST